MIRRTLEGYDYTPLVFYSILDASCKRSYLVLLNPTVYRSILIMNPKYHYLLTGPRWKEGFEKGDPVEARYGLSYVPTAQA